MRGFRFDWRWVALIALVAILANSAALPWPVLFAAMAGGGGYLLYEGWKVWVRASGGSVGGPRVTYWRGQKIELRPQNERRGLPPMSWRTIGPALLYLVIGGALILAALAVLLRQFGA